MIKKKNLIKRKINNPKMMRRKKKKKLYLNPKKPFIRIYNPNKKHKTSWINLQKEMDKMILMEREKFQTQTLRIKSKNSLTTNIRTISKKTMTIKIIRIRINT